MESSYEHVLMFNWYSQLPWTRLETTFDTPVAPVRFIEIGKEYDYGKLDPRWERDIEKARLECTES